MGLYTTKNIYRQFLYRSKLVTVVIQFVLPTTASHHTKQEHFAIFLHSKKQDLMIGDR